MTPQYLHSFIETWLKSNDLILVTEFWGNFTPRNDPQDDYEVTYQAVLEPNTDDRARVEVWLTKEARIAIGIETRERLARRLGLRKFRGGFAAGREPGSVSEGSLRMLLEAAARGLFGIRYFKLFGLLGSTEAVMSQANHSTLARYDPQYFKWIVPLSDQEISSPKLFHGIAEYHAWNGTPPTASISIPRSAR
jgi:hypothetical protein